MEYLAKYYTADIFSKLLVDRLSSSSPKNIVELGVGGGALVKAAIKRWLDASYYIADIDSNSVAKIKSELPFVNTFQFDTIKENVSEKLRLGQGTVDIAVCNPPYLRLKNEINFSQLFEDSKLLACQKLKYITTDIIFLAKNLQLLRDQGELGIILPDSLITGKDFEGFRKAILEEHHLKAIIQLPENIFPKTEALTHILFIEKGSCISESTSLLLANKNGIIIDETEINKSALVERMDFKFHSFKKGNITKVNLTTIKDLKVDIKRGNLTHKELKSLYKNYVHTTNLEHKNAKLGFLSTEKIYTKCLLTKKGDILLSRVGKIGKMSMVWKGKVPISDCIYCIRVPKKYRRLVWKSFTSKNGENWFNAYAHGVCAKLISKKDLLNFPIKII